MKIEIAKDRDGYLVSMQDADALNARKPDVRARAGTTHLVIGRGKDWLSFELTEKSAREIAKALVKWADEKEKEEIEDIANLMKREREKLERSDEEEIDEDLLRSEDAKPEKSPGHSPKTFTNVKSRRPRGGK